MILDAKTAIGAQEVVKDDICDMCMGCYPAKIHIRQSKAISRMHEMARQFGTARNRDEPLCMRDIVTTQEREGVRAH